ncbi:MAG: two-component system sensor histidine kinase NtrB [bacterium]
MSLNTDQQAALLDSLNTATLLSNIDGKILYMNTKAQSLLQLNQFDIGKSINTCCPNGKIIFDAINKSYSSGQQFFLRQQEMHSPFDKTAHLDLIITPHADDQNNILIELHDISWYIETQQEEVINQQQSVAQDFLRGLAHEIKNPLGGMKGAGQLLKKHLKNEHIEYLDIILNEIDRLGKLVDQMGQTTSIENFSSANIHEPLEQTRLLLESEMKQKLQIIRDYDPSIPEIPMYKDLLTQAFINLGRNAIEAGATRLTFQTRIVHAASVGLPGSQMAIQINITDNGNGIPEHLGDNILLPMISGRAEGSGFGLAFVQQAAKKHHGLLQYNSSKEGSTFSLVLSLKGCQS